jgi:hypothetical protein
VDVIMASAVLLAFAFAVTNGLHDASNAIATLVAMRAARPRHALALALAAVFNLLGPLLVGGAVASAIGGIVTIGGAEGIDIIAAGLLAAVAWNLITWRWGLPSSRARCAARCSPRSSHRSIRRTSSRCRAGSTGSSTTPRMQSVKAERRLEKAYLGALVELDDVRAVMGRQELYRRCSRMGESVVDVAERLIYAVLKEN